MSRIARVVAVLVLVTSGTAFANEEAEAVEPVTITVENTCDTDLHVDLAGTAIAVAKGTTTEAQTLPGQDDHAFELKLGKDDPKDLGLLGMAPGSTFHVKFMNCKDGVADIISQLKSERPADISPNAAAKVRFRALNRGSYQEYRAGKKGRFKALSVGYTSYEERKAGPFEFTIRVRPKKRGPVLGMAKKQVDLMPGHKYLVETNVISRTVFFKFEDEGWDSAKPVVKKKKGKAKKAMKKKVINKKPPQKKP